MQRRAAGVLLRLMPPASDDRGASRERGHESVVVCVLVVLSLGVLAVWPTVLAALGYGR